MNVVQQKYNFIVKKVCSFFSSYLVQTVSFILYKIMVDMIYLLYNGGEWGICISPMNIISVYLGVIVFSYFIFIYCRECKASSIMMILFNMIYFVPITTYCSLGPGSNELLFFTLVFWGILSFLQLKIPVAVLKKGKPVVLDRSFYVLFAGVFFLTIYISAKYTGFRIITNLMDVYQFRAEALTYHFPTWLTYLQKFSTILIPLLILLAFCKKKYIFALIGCFLLLLNFSFAGHKSVFFMGIILILGYLFWRREMVTVIVPGGILLGVFAILEEKIFSHTYINSFFFRRQQFIVAELSDQYFRYFKNHPTDIFRGTFLEKLGFDSPYALPLSKVIGGHYTSQVINCNNGLLTDVWSHLGYIGILIMPIIFLVCFRLFDMATDKLESKYFVGLAVYYAAVFSNSTWSTVLLTHGFLIMCLFFFLFPRKSKDEVNI